MGRMFNVAAVLTNLLSIHVDEEVEVQRLDVLEPHLKTGDLLLCRKSEFLRPIALRSPWRHVGVLWRDSDGQLYVWESTHNDQSIKLKDAWTGKLKEGPQLIPFREKICNYHGHCAVRQLLGGSDSERDKMGQALKRWMPKIRKLGFERNPVYYTALFWANVNPGMDDGYFLERRKHRKGLSCGELVAWTYQKLGILGKRKLYERYVPPDFSGNIVLRAPLQFGPILGVSWAE